MNSVPAIFYSDLPFRPNPHMSYHTGPGKMCNIHCDSDRATRTYCK